MSVSKIKIARVNFVNQEIKKAIVNTTEKSSLVLQKQVIVILNLYMRITDTAVSEDQIKFLSSITQKQADVIIKKLRKINK